MRYNILVYLYLFTLGEYPHDEKMLSLYSMYITWN